ncbi:DNA topoisomerase [Pelagophyceae sp. CCMP2097]|nr:DNA topoisomerase [Pelagophyceae sp. CCMP2097]
MRLVAMAMAVPSLLLRSVRPHHSLLFCRVAGGFVAQTRTFAVKAAKKGPSRATKAAAKAAPTVAAVEAPPENEVTPIQLDAELSDSFMRYAMASILSRALPDVRDGLKPVHRRILYAIRELNLQPSTPYRKCARVVGEVLGKFHPHSDTSVYDALVRMAQDWVMSTQLVNIHGNFGSVDGDPPAAMRYTECRMSKFTWDAMMNSDDLGRVALYGNGTDEGICVDFAENFDGSEMEPLVLPARVPLLLVNGASGIAVGMATNIPPHNLGEVIDASILFARAKAAQAASGAATCEVPAAALAAVLPAPDFPTGGKIIGTAGVDSMYSTGQGRIIMRAKTHVEVVKSGRTAIIATEIPYMVNKAELLTHTADLVQSRKIEGLADLKDESGRQGMRIVYELKRDANPDVVLNSLLQSTRLQTSFPANIVAVDTPLDDEVQPDADGPAPPGMQDSLQRRPQRMSVQQILFRWVAFRFDCIRRRAAHTEARSALRLHLVEGYRVAQVNTDAVVGIIRGSASPADARVALAAAVFADDASEAPVKLSEAQADAILKLQLSRLTTLESDKLRAEQVTLEAELAGLRRLMREDSEVYSTMISELESIKKKHAGPRRTEIVQEYVEFSAQDTIENARSIVTVSRTGFMKRMAVGDFTTQGRGSRGKAGTPKNKADGVVEHVASCNDHDTLICISDDALAFGMRAFDVPMTTRTARGAALPALFAGIAEKTTLSGVFAVSAANFTESSLSIVVLTNNGAIKRTPLQAFDKINKGGLILTKLNDGDKIGWVRLCKEDDDIIVGTAFGLLLRFTCESLRVMSRTAAGPSAMTLKEGDRIVSMDIFDASKHSHVLLVTELGYGKRLAAEDVKVAKRNGRGQLCTKFKPASADRLASICCCADADEAMIITRSGVVVRQAVSTMSVHSRKTTGFLVQKIEGGSDDTVSNACLVPRDVAGNAESENGDDGDEEDEQ